LLLVSTPFGKNHQWYLHMMARELKDWYVLLKKTSEINHVPQEALEAERKRMSPEKFLQEYECFPGDMCVKTDKDLKKIKDVAIDDLVLTHNNVYRKVTAVIKRHYKGEIIIINGETFDTIKCTPNHRLFSAEEFSWGCGNSKEWCTWIRADELLEGDKLYFPEASSLSAIVSIKTEIFNDIVYNLSVEEDESYCVSGAAVHNCSYERGVEGTYYGRALESIRQRGQITSVAWEPGLLTHVAIDIGVSDATTLIWFQVVGEGTVIRIIDCYSNNGVGLDHYAKILQDKPYRMGQYFAPHDLKVREWGGGAITRYEKARQLGIDFTILDQIGVADGIENVLTHFPKFWIDETNCRSLIDALENYYREWDESKRKYNDKPLKSWAAHYADALRYLCMGLHKTTAGLSADKFNEIRNKHIYGNRQNPWDFFANSDSYKRF